LVPSQIFGDGIAVCHLRVNEDVFWLLVDEGAILVLLFFDGFVHLEEDGVEVEVGGGLCLEGEHLDGGGGEVIYLFELLG
jgi:hypothetical protein